MHVALKFWVVLVPFTHHCLGHAQEGGIASYPAKPIRIIQPAPPGGASDVVLRAVAQKVSAAMGQTMVVDKRPGGHGLIANELTKEA